MTKNEPNTKNLFPNKRNKINCFLRYDKCVRYNIYMRNYTSHINNR